MKTWKSAVALAFAGVLVSTVAFAQATTPSGDQKAPGDSDTTKSGAADMDKADTSGAMKSGTSDTMMKSGKAAHGGNRDQVRAAQQALKDKGHDPGMVDGVMGPKTQAALKDFQKSQGIQDTGRLDAETMAKLGIEGRSGAAGQSSPSASPSTSGSPSDSSAKPSDSGVKK
jgi:peptidoglycan hydrolase-like protein with peptidoglycan-binding domain